jgi:hypothetical protein
MGVKFQNKSFVSIYRLQEKKFATPLDVDKNFKFLWQEKI